MIFERELKPININAFLHDYEIKNVYFKRPRNFNRVQKPKVVYVKSAKGQKAKVKAQKYNCVVKCNYGKPTNLKDHVYYIGRDGAGLNGDKAMLFDEQKEFSSKGFKPEFLPNEKRYFKFVISPEKKDVDLKQFALETVNYIERQQNQKLHFIASIHHNTAKPHVHLIVRGIDKVGQDVWLKKDLIRFGVREHLIGKIEQEYGHKTEFEVLQDMYKSTGFNYVTKIDRAIAYKMQNRPNKLGYFGYVCSNDIEYQRLMYLSKIGLAKQTKIEGKKGFAIKENFIDTLRETQIQNDIVKQHALALKKGQKVTRFLKENQKVYGKILNHVVNPDDFTISLSLQESSGKVYALKLPAYSKDLKNFKTGGEIIITKKDGRMRAYEQNKSIDL